jgi:hypothetical protein
MDFNVLHEKYAASYCLLNKVLFCKEQTMNNEEKERKKPKSPLWPLWWKKKEESKKKTQEKQKIELNIKKWKRYVERRISYYF